MIKQDADHKKLSWFVPRWSYTQRLWSQLNEILNPASVLRIGVGTAVVSALLIAGCKWMVPQFVLPNLWPLVLAFPAMVLMLVIQLAILTLIPPIATIRTNRILVQHGQSSTNIDAQSVTATYLTFHSAERIRLRVCYNAKTKTKSSVIGVPPTVDFDRLTELLPVDPIVRDARNRSFVKSNHRIE